jgi:hypothetical protein
MVRSRIALWMRGGSAVAVVAFSVVLAGCVVDTSEAIPEVDEEVAEAESQLDESALGEDVQPGDDQKDPDPTPWRAHTTSPDPDPDMLVNTLPSGPSNHDE